MILGISLITGVISFLIYLYQLQQSGDHLLAQTSAFATLGTATLAYAYSLRNTSLPIWRSTIFSNRYLNMAIIISFLLQLSAIYLPWLQLFLHTRALSLAHWLPIGLAVGIILIAIEVLKMVSIRIKAQKKKAA